MVFYEEKWPVQLTIQSHAASAEDNHDTLKHVIEGFIGTSLHHTAYPRDAYSEVRINPDSHFYCFIRTFLSKTVNFLSFFIESIGQKKIQ